MVETEEITLEEAPAVDAGGKSEAAKKKGTKKGVANAELGYRGELAAARYLTHQGYELLERQFKCRAGEADIIARIEDCICFIEVKTRTGTAKGFPEEAVDARKRDRYERIAAYYLKDHVEEELRVRFDVISIIVLSENHAFLRYHKNAYGVDW